MSDADLRAEPALVRLPLSHLVAADANPRMTFEKDAFQELRKRILREKTFNRPTRGPAAFTPAQASSSSRTPSTVSASMIQAILARTRQLLHTRGAPIVIALDGPSGSGKSTIANALAATMPVTIIPSDDFFAADLTAADWDARSAAERARDAIDWRRLRQSALEPLRAGQPAVWHPFDFAAGEGPDGSYPMSPSTVRREPAPIIIIDGAYSARPELADVVDLSILIEAPSAIRHERLTVRESPAFLEAWHRRWDAAEVYYFREVRPPASFDMVVDTHGRVVRDQHRTTNSDDPAA